MSDQQSSSEATTGESSAKAPEAPPSPPGTPPQSGFPLKPMASILITLALLAGFFYWESTRPTPSGTAGIPPAATLGAPAQTGLTAPGAAAGLMKEGAAPGAAPAAISPRRRRGNRSPGRACRFCLSTNC